VSRTEASRAGRVGPAWVNARDACYDSETVCWLCGDWVNQDLPRGHPYARTADHLIQLCHGGPPADRANLHLAHGRCNTARSNKLRNLPVEQCACSHGLPCNVLQPSAPRGYVAVDLSTV
jgi:5-methylcytosine-specific restriction endonuclease McrA